MKKNTKKAATQKRKGKVPRRRELLEPGLHLIVDFKDGQFKILRSAPVRNAPARALQPPFLEPSKTYAFATPVSEVVLDLLDPKGTIVHSFGWSWTADAFFERPVRGVRSGIRGGRMASSQTLRILLVPLPKAATFLVFSRSDVGAGSDASPQRVKRTGLAIYSLPSSPPVVPGLPFPVDNLEPTPLPTPILRPEAR